MFSSVLLSVGLLAFWKAEPIGSALRQLDGGKLGRTDIGLGTGPGAYTFFVRLAAGPLAFCGAVALAVALLR